ncbi:hypothetical protein ACIBHX_49245 [Nonomuraea sp. NPDC050536]|uniref:hypothetical protein n=1 Tax=Nonomuraea sp. NPDC050536 TaxID=3364366 RepID=UPI0037C881A4
MGLEVPAGLRPVMELAGCPWPDVDETVLCAAGWRLVAHGERRASAYAGAVEAVDRALAANQGRDVEALRGAWEEFAGARRDGVSACRVLGLALIGAAALVLAWKVLTIAQLVAAAVALALGLMARLPVTRQAVRAGLKALAEALDRGPVSFIRQARTLLRRLDGQAGKHVAARPDYLAVAADRATPVDDLVASELRRPGTVWRTDRAPVFHGSRTAPEAIHDQGLLPYLPGEHVYTHRYMDEAESYSRGAYVYEVHVPGGFARPDGTVVFPGGVDRRFIRGAHRLSDGEFLPNPHFDPR